MSEFDLYDFLDNSLLFEDAHLESGFAKISEREMEQHLQAYRVARLAASGRTPLSVPGAIVVFAKATSIKAELLTQCAFYVDKFYMLDPLFEASEPPDAIQGAMGVDPQALRLEVRESLTYLKRVRPLVEAGFLAFGVRENAEVPRNIPLLRSENNFFDHVPKHLLDKLRERALVRNKIITEDGRHLVMKDPVYSRHFAVSFKGDKPGIGYGFDYPREIDPRDEETWRFFADNATNRAAWMFVSDIEESWRLAASFRATLITESSLAVEVFGSQPPRVMSDLALGPLLGFHVPFVVGVDAATIMSIRNGDGEAFLSFRSALEKRLADLARITDPVQMRQEQIKMVNDLQDVQVREISRRVRAIVLQQSLQGALAFATLVATPLGPLSLPIAAGFVVARAHQAVTELRGNPYFFLWKLDQGKRRKHG